MGVASAAMAGLSLYKGYGEAQFAKMQANNEARQLEQNSKIMKMKAEDTVRQGDYDADTLKRKSKGIIGSQRAGFASGNIDINSGSALDVQGDTAAETEIDAIAIRNNAFREAMGYKMEASNMKSQAKIVKATGRASANLSLLGGGVSAVGNYYQYKK